MLRSFGMNPSDAELQDMVTKEMIIVAVVYTNIYFKVNDVDADGNGCIDFTEFLGLVKNLKTETDSDDLHEAFK